jgi:hypothetical protein
MVCIPKYWKLTATPVSAFRCIQAGFHADIVYLDEAIANDQAHNVRHEAVGVAETKFPFRSEQARDIFVAALADVQAAGIIPEYFSATYYPTELVQSEIETTIREKHQRTVCTLKSSIGEKIILQLYRDRCETT